MIRCDTHLSSTDAHTHPANPPHSEENKHIFQLGSLCLNETCEGLRFQRSGRKGGEVGCDVAHVCVFVWMRKWQEYYKKKCSDLTLT